MNHVRLRRGPDGGAGISRLSRRIALVGPGLAVLLLALPLHAAQVDIAGPAGSVAFGTAVAALPNGNIVVTDPHATVADIANAGAAYLYSPTGVLISTLTGSHAEDLVGIGGITVLANGNYVIDSLAWGNGNDLAVGAVTWANGATGVSGAVSAANSLVGGVAYDTVGSNGVTALPNGNYVVSSVNWSGAGVAYAGAVTWANGATGLAGVVSAANSLVGTTVNDRIGSDGVVVLANGNYVVRSSFWQNGAVIFAGAVTWGSGATGIAGAVTAANSLVGSTNFDGVGLDAVTPLTNGNYVVASSNWSSGQAYVGAATWANGATGLSGPVSAANSLVGSTSADTVGNGGVVALSNGNYVVRSYNWDKGAVVNAGAATWGNGATGTAGTVSAANSLVGAVDEDLVGYDGIVALANGSYVVCSAHWDLGAVSNAGAVTWANGTAPTAATVSAGNSLVGTSAEDGVGNGCATTLANGNYVVRSFTWDNGAVADAGAATWSNGATGLVGAVTAANSLVGSHANDLIGYDGVTALANGHYVVCSSLWQNGAEGAAGAATWGNGAGGTTGPVQASNSLIGTRNGDTVGNGCARALTNGNYVVSSTTWSSALGTLDGAATWRNGSAASPGMVSAANSLIGSAIGDRLGYDGGTGGVKALIDGNYLVVSALWDNGSTVDAGAVTLAPGSVATTGYVAAENSVRGTVDAAGATHVYAYDPSRHRLAVGRPASNLVTLMYGPDVLFSDGYE